MSLIFLSKIRRINNIWFNTFISTLVFIFLRNFPRNSEEKVKKKKKTAAEKLRLPNKLKVWLWIFRDSRLHSFADVIVNFTMNKILKSNIFQKIFLLTLAIRNRCKWMLNEMYSNVISNPHFVLCTWIEQL